ncbi:hypothetical protein FRB95_003214 [Tulasnella sp. JGI-2019a]|nr:hypothetical protein FRB95_003214 [Tulasnella sp. JGI-2019a]
METTWKITIATLKEVRTQFADWAITKLSAFATQSFSAPVPEPPPPTPTRTYYISQPLFVTPTSSPAHVSPSLLQPYTILLLLILAATVTVLVALRVYKHTSTRLPPLSPLYPRDFDHLTSNDIADVKDWSKDDLCQLISFLFVKLSDASNANARLVPTPVAESQPPVDVSIANDGPLRSTEVEMTEPPPVGQDHSTPSPPEHIQSRSRRASTSAPAETTHFIPPPPPPTTSDPEFDLLPEPNHAPLLLSKLLYIACAFQRLENIFGIPSFDSETAALIAKCDHRTFSQLVGPRLAFVEDRITLQLMHLEGRNKLATDLADARIKHDVLRDEYDNVIREYADLVASCTAQTESRDPGSLRSSYPFVLLGLVLVCYVQFYLDV